MIRAEQDLYNCGVIGQACFAAGTKLLTPTGPKAIEQFKPGDAIISRAEHLPDGPLETKVVEEVFQNTASILHLHVGGKVIRTTGEHPFFAYNKGWVNANELTLGDYLLGDDNRLFAVEGVYETGEWEVVYNLRIADHHTYFVTDWGWGFCVWSHNECAFRAMSATDFALASQGLWLDSPITDNAGEKWFWDSEVAAIGWRRWLRDRAAPMGAAARTDAHLSSQIIAKVCFDTPLASVASRIDPHTLPGVPGGVASAYSISFVALAGKQATLVNMFLNESDPP